ncbi:MULTISPECIES: bacteriocin-like protein [Chryseobacterium]|jgi:hypothetical protein|uniref:bacteriocin-like protein n=1 Tax=Chryseobacterium TaxID=59732 RepID=UPI000AF68B6A|nr:MULTISPECIES: hypothetical protein [Chryseobacterium]
MKKSLKKLTREDLKGVNGGKIIGGGGSAGFPCYCEGVLKGNAGTALECELMCS